MPPPLSAALAPQVCREEHQLLRPGAMKYVVTPEGTHHSKLPPPPRRREQVHRESQHLHEYPLITEGMQRAQTDSPCEKSTVKLIVKTSG